MFTCSCKHCEIITKLWFAVGTYKIVTASKNTRDCVSILPIIANRCFIVDTYKNLTGLKHSSTSVCVLLWWLKKNVWWSDLCFVVGSYTNWAMSMHSSTSAHTPNEHGVWPEGWKKGRRRRRKKKKRKRKRKEETQPHAGEQEGGEELGTLESSGWAANWRLVWGRRVGEIAAEGSKADYNPTTLSTAW